jgi:hypothetical protein
MCLLLHRITRKLPLAFMCILHVILHVLLSLMKCVRQRQRGRDDDEERRAERCVCEEGSEMAHEGGEQRSEGSKEARGAVADGLVGMEVRGQIKTERERRSRPRSQPSRYSMPCASRSRRPSAWCAFSGSSPAQKPSAPPFKMLNFSYQFVSESWMSSAARGTHATHAIHTKHTMHAARGIHTLAVTTRHHSCIAA